MDLGTSQAHSWPDRGQARDREQWAAEVRGAPLSLRRRARPVESVARAAVTFCGLASIAITLATVYYLGREASLFFRSSEVSLAEFLTGRVWQPQIGHFGILPLVSATLLTSIIGMAVAVPLGLAAAIYLSEYASDRTRSVLKPLLEVLAGVPTVVYGYFALTFVTPILRSLFGRDVVEIYNTGSAGIVIGILILPLIASMSEDAFAAVPQALREGALALGATRLEVALGIVLPAAASGVAAAMILGLSRAVGETMIVAIAAGAGPRLTLNPFRAAETMTGYIARISGGDVSYDSLDYNSIFAIGLLLFLITLALNLLGRMAAGRWREQYE